MAAISNVTMAELTTNAALLGFLCFMVVGAIHAAIGARSRRKGSCLQATQHGCPFPRLRVIASFRIAYFEERITTKHAKSTKVGERFQTCT